MISCISVWVVAYDFGNKFGLSTPKNLSSCIWRRQQRKAADGYVRIHYKEEGGGQMLSSNRLYALSSVDGRRDTGLS